MCWTLCVHVGLSEKLKSYTVINMQMSLGRHCVHALQGVFRGLGDTRSPLWATLICNGVNVVLDAVFIMYFGWGVTGAAWATIIGQVDVPPLMHCSAVLMIHGHSTQKLILHTQQCIAVAVQAPYVG